MIWEIIFMVVISLLMYITYTYIKHLLQLKNYPPGPFPLPILGNINLMSDKPYESFRDLAKIYGDVFSISMGTQRMVVINTIEPTREALITKGKIFAGRPSLYTTSLITRGRKDIAMADYSTPWKVLKKIASVGLKMQVEGGATVKENIVEESEALHHRLKANKGKAVDIHDHLCRFIYILYLQESCLC